MLAVACLRSGAFRSVLAVPLMADLANASDINLPVQLGVGLHIADIFELFQGSCCGSWAITILSWACCFLLKQCCRCALLC